MLSSLPHAAVCEPCFVGNTMTSSSSGFLLSDARSDFGRVASSNGCAMYAWAFSRVTYFKRQLCDLSVPMLILIEYRMVTMLASAVAIPNAWGPHSGPDAGDVGAMSSASPRSPTASPTHSATSPTIRRMSADYDKAIDLAMQRMPPFVVAGEVGARPPTAAADAEGLGAHSPAAPAAAAQHAEGLGPGLGPGQAPGPGPGLGPGQDPGQGSGLGRGQGPGQGPGLGPGPGPRPGQDPAAAGWAAGAAPLTDEERGELVALRAELHRLGEVQAQPRPLTPEQQQQLARLEALELKHSLQPHQLPSAAQGAPQPPPPAQVCAAPRPTGASGWFSETLLLMLQLACAKQ